MNKRTLPIGIAFLFIGISNHSFQEQHARNIRRCAAHHCRNRLDDSKQNEPRIN
jgi:hypothetical protein